MHFCPAHTHSLSLSLHEPKPKRKPQIPNPKHNSPSPVAFPAAVMTRPSLTNVSLWVNLPYPVVVKALRLSNRRRVLCIGVQRNKSIFFQCCSVCPLGTLESCHSCRAKDHFFAEYRRERPCTLWVDCK
ncbi:uncharacterized protein LOC111397537 [Olea europaea var. sylvestris]|uniref:uncharacterized protein LOC111397537 n=1 Tax=Olea europaea var. sylvestris TaxID=158386 RepID=UPI000C1D1D19|nr:uncharacterized protein LOC111397537 [Olea europaea var. sylvestris]